MPHDDQPPGGSNFFRQLSDAMDLPFILVGSVVIGAGAGYFLDRHFHTDPILTLVLGALGFAAGIYEVLRRVMKKRN